MAKCKTCEEKQEAFQKLITEFISSPAKIGEKVFEDFKITTHTWVRKFSKDLNPSDLKWHCDESDRIIFAINENDWEFQFDNELPIKLPVNEKIQITKDLWHRSIKGSTDLVLFIQEV